MEHFANETESLIGADILISVSDLLGGLILVYRCWVIWGKNTLVVLLPLLTALAGFGEYISPPFSLQHSPHPALPLTSHACPIACIVVVAHFVLSLTPTAPVPPAAIVPLGTAGYVLPLATNAMATVLIVVRLWLTARGAEQRVGTRMRGTVRAAQRAVAIIVESGLLYLVTQLVFVVLFALGHPAQAILAVVAVQVYVSSLKL